MDKRANYSFSRVPHAEIPRSHFMRSHGYKTSYDAGFLIPFYVDEALPGDTFNVRVSILARLATPIFPVLDNMYVDVHFFFVPNRLVWANWQKFCGEQFDPGDSIAFIIPQVIPVAAAKFLEASVADYMGVPTDATDLSVSALPFRCYNLIYNQWYRDQNLQDSAVEKTDDTTQQMGQYPMRRRGKRHDYFTSCLPFPQRGAGVSLPLGTSAPVIAATPAVHPSFNIGSNTDKGFVRGVPDPAEVGWESGDPGAGGITPAEWNTTGLIADLSTATAATINSLRQAFQIQKLLERDARGGTRYTEIVKSHFGVTSPDARLQRPEYLGGGSIQMNFNPVENASGTGTQGELAAFAIGTGTGIGFVKSFVEHGTIMGICSTRADLNYQQALNRMWSRSTRNDFYWPAFAHLGEQAVLNKEIWAQGPTVTSGPDIVDDLIFGYQERWAEYRYHPSLVTAKMRSSSGTPLDQWHLAQEFSVLPLLNAAFIEENPPVDRVIAVPSQPHFLMDSWFEVKTARPMPTYSVPGLIDHF